MTSLDEVYEDIDLDPYWDDLRLPGIKLVRGYGQTSRPKVMLVGEAPGATENARGRPFCGPSGVVLNHLMAEAGLRLDESHRADGTHGAPGCQPANAYVTNVVKYRPPQNRTPTLHEIWHARDDLRAEWLALGGPKLIICVGATAHAALNPMAGLLSVGDCKGQLYNPVHPKTGAKNREYWIISQYHPAYGLRGGPGRQKAMTLYWQDMGKQIREMGIL